MHKNNFAIVPFNSILIKDKYLVSNILGGWDLLSEGEFKRLNSFKLDRDSELFNRLYNKKIVVDENNFKSLIDDYRNLNANLFNDTSLHIAVVTTRCNLKCKYCQTKSLTKEDMSYEIASRVLKYIFDVNNLYVTLEFQGGEPLLNWEVLRFLIEHARKFNTGKNLKIAVVTNLTLLDDEKAKFLVDNDVSICTSLDGPEDVLSLIHI